MSFTAASCIYFSMFYHHHKIAILREVNALDNFLNQRFNVPNNNKLFARILRNYFLIYWTLMVISYISLISNAYVQSNTYIRYTWHYISLNFIVHLQCFQFFTFATLIETRLKVLSEVDVESIEQAANFKKALTKAKEISQKSCNCFSSSILITSFWLYGSIVSNMHWIGLALLGASYSNYMGEFKDVICLRE